MAFDLASAQPITAPPPLAPTDHPAFDLASARPVQTSAQPPGPAPVSALDRAQAVPTGFNEGVAQLLGLPVDTARNVIDLVKAGLGYAQSKITGQAPSPAFDPADRSQDVGGSQWIASKLNSTPLGNLTEAPRPDDPLSRVIHAAAGGVPQALTGGAGEAHAATELATQAPNLLRQAATGAAGGASGQVASEFGASPGTQALASLIGGAGAAAAHAPGSVSEPKAPVPTKEQLGTAASAAYKRATDAGVVITPESFDTLKSTIADTMQQQGIDPTLQPKTTAVLGRIADTQGPVTLDQVETLRKVAKAAQGSTADNPSDRRLANQVIDHIDDYVDGLKPQDVTAGDSDAAVQTLQDARNLYSRNRKAQTIDDMTDRAQIRASQFSGSGMENAIRTEFRQLSMNPRRMRTFTPEEQDAITQVATGGPLENGLRMLGKFAPTGIVSSALSGGVGAALGTHAGVPVEGALALPAMGFAARTAATRLQMRNVQRLQELMRRGPPGSAPLSRPQDADVGEWPVPPAAPLALPHPDMLATNRGGIATDSQLQGLGLTPDVARAGALHPGAENLVPERAPPAPLALPKPGDVAIPMSNDAAQGKSLAESLGLTPDVLQAQQQHPGMARLAPSLQANRAPLALPAPTREPLVVDQEGRAAADPAQLAGYRKSMGLDELGAGVKQPAAGENAGREANAAQLGSFKGVALTGKEFATPGEPIGSLVRKAGAYAKQNFSGKTVTNASDGSQILISPAGIDHAMSGQVSRKAALAVAQLDKVLEQGKLVSSEPDKLGRDTIKNVYRYETPISIAGQPATIESIVREHADGRRYYDHSEVRTGSGEGPAAGGPKGPVRSVSKPRPAGNDPSAPKFTPGATGEHIVLQGNRATSSAAPIEQVGG